MGRFRTIQYASDPETGMTWSRVGNEVAVPMLDFEGMKPENGFAMTYILEKASAVGAFGGTHLKWTRKIPIAVKNKHREFWGMRPIVGD
jgi:hypothetical protein